MTTDSKPEPTEHAQRMMLAAHDAIQGATRVSVDADALDIAVAAVTALDRPVYAAELLARLTSREAVEAHCAAGFPNWTHVFDESRKEECRQEAIEEIRAAFAVATSTGAVGRQPNAADLASVAQLGLDLIAAKERAEKAERAYAELNGCFDQSEKDRVHYVQKWTASEAECRS